MNIKQLYTQLTKIFLVTDEEITLLDTLAYDQLNLFAPFTLASYQIRKILTDVTLNDETKRNHLEAFLIEKIKSEDNIQSRESYSLALRISLHARGYFTDDLGQLEKLLLLLPLEDSLNPDQKFANNPLVNQILWLQINKVRVELLHCFNIQESYCSKLERLAKAMRRIINKHHHLKSDSTTATTEKEIQESIRLFISNFLDKALKQIDEAMVQKNNDDWSLWASAALEGLDYIRDLTSQTSIDHIELSKHQTRLTYFVTFLHAFNEPICIYINSELTKSSIIPLEKLEEMKNSATLPEIREKSLKNNELFLKAYQSITAVDKPIDFLNRIFQIAIALESDGCSIGTFIRITACIMTEPLSHKQWLSYLEILKCIAVPLQWQNQLSDIWLVLAEFFVKNYSNDRVFFKEAALSCITKTNTPPQCNVTEISDIEILSGLLQQLKQDSLKERPSQKNITLYTKNTQYALCKFLIQDTRDYDIIDTPILDGIITELLDSKNPYCLAEIVKVLSVNSILKDSADRVVEIKYNSDTKNPRVFCEQVLQPMNFNKYFLIWGPLVCREAINPNYLPTNTIEDLHFTDEIQLTRCVHVRHQLREELFNDALNPNIVSCGFMYLKVLDKKLYELQFRLMSNRNINKLFYALNFTEGRPGLIQAVYALLFFYNGNYYAAEQMADLSLQYAPVFQKEEKRTSHILTSASIQPSIIGTPDGGNSPETQRKLFSPPPKTSPRLIITPTAPAESPETSPRSAPSLPTNTGLPLKLLRVSDPSSLSNGRTSSPSSTRIGANRSPSEVSDISSSPINSTRTRSITINNRSPNGPNDLSSTISSPRVRSLTIHKIPSNTSLSSNLESKRSTTLGYLIKAMIMWETRLKNNKHRSETDIAQFKTLLESTQKSSEPDEERNFITGMRWLCYLNSYNESTRKYDILWLLGNDKEQYKSNKGNIKTKDKARIRQIQSLKEGDLREYTLYKLVRYYLTNKQSTDNPNTKKFPPALLIIYQYLGLYMKKYPPTDPLLIEKEKEEFARSLKESLYLAGYFPAIPTYLNQYSLAHPIKEEDAEVITTGFTPLDRIALIKLALKYSETTFPFQPMDTETISKHLREIEASEHSKLESIRSYKEEIPQGFKSQFVCLPIKISTDISQLHINFIENDKKHYDCCIQSNSDDFESLHQLFLRATRVYSYCKKVTLSTENIVLCQNNSIIIKHADIAVLGILFLVDLKITSLLLPKFEIAPLRRFLIEAYALKDTTWQWYGTYKRLHNFMQHTEAPSIDEGSKDLDSEELRARLIPLSPTSEQQSSSSSPRSGSSITPFKTRGSLIMKTVRRGSTADVSSGSSPCSPRGNANTPSRRDSGKVSIPDTSDGSMGSIPRKTGTEPKKVTSNNK